MKTFSVKTFGCKVNQYESQEIRERLIAAGYGETVEPDADIYIVNTCCVTARAEAKSHQFINRIRRRKPVIVVTGCSVDYKPDSFPQTDILVPNRKKTAITDILNCHIKEQEKGIPAGEEEPIRQNNKGIGRFSGRTRAFVKVQDGCDQFCSYCILPYVRGRSRSRPIEEVVNEAKRLADNGYRELVLTGIHLGDYYKDKNSTSGLVMLLERLVSISQLLRIRLSSLEPQDISADIIDIVARYRKICNHFHLPLQSGSDRILRSMNREYTYSGYRQLITTIRKRIPEVNFTTDVITGFPGETDNDFAASCRAVAEIGFSKVHIFPYSRRAGTKAAEFSGSIPIVEARSRVRELQEIADKTAAKIKGTLKGKRREILVENPGRKLTGYTSDYIPVTLMGPAARNELVRVQIKGLEGPYLVAVNCPCKIPAI